VETQLRAGRFRAIERRSSDFFSRIRSISDASTHHGQNSWLNQPSRTSLRKVLGSFISRHLILTALPCAVVLLWCSIPFPKSPESTSQHSAKSTAINFWFFLFIYYGFYNLVGLLWITKLFNLYSLNWWPPSLGGAVSYFLFWSLSVVLGAVIYLVTGLEKYTLTWVLLTFVTMVCPIVAAFIMLLKARRFTTSGIIADQVFEESYGGRGVPASYLRFLWFCTAVILALVTFVLGETYAWIYFSTLPHSNIDALLYVYSWVGTIHLLDGLTGWILSNRVENYPIIFAFKFYYSLTYQIYVRNLYARLRSPEQFLIVQLASFVGVVILSPLQMTCWAHKLMKIVTNSSSDLEDYRHLVGRSFFLRNLAENVTMVSFLGWVSILHFGGNRLVYPYFSFEETTDRYTYNLTFYASLVIWVSELVSSFITRYIMRRVFKHNVTEEAMKDFERYPDLLPCSM